MKRMINKLILKLKNKIRAWLGLNDMFMGVDYGGMKDQSCIVIISRLGDGQVRIIDSHFGNVADIQHLVSELKARYGINDKNIFEDYPGYWNPRSHR